eukprot:1159625-Pelagomonas_calceolata.AAC.2
MARAAQPRVLMACAPPGMVNHIHNNPLTCCQGNGAGCTAKGADGMRSPPHSQSWGPASNEPAGQGAHQSHCPCLGRGCGSGCRSSSLPYMGTGIPVGGTCRAGCALELWPQHLGRVAWIRVQEGVGHYENKGIQQTWQKEGGPQHSWHAWRGLQLQQQAPSKGQTASIRPICQLLTPAQHANFHLAVELAVALSRAKGSLAAMHAQAWSRAQRRLCKTQPSRQAGMGA